MSWPIMTDEELHAFGIELILPYVKKEGLIIEFVNTEIKQFPQIVGQRWGSLAYVYVKTACYPNKGALTTEEFLIFHNWAVNHNATPFFASVGIACVAYPDKTPVVDDSEMGIPYRSSGYAVAYTGMVIMTTSDNATYFGDVI